MATLLEKVKTHLRIDHEAFDEQLNFLIEVGKSSMKNAGVTLSEESSLQQMTIVHFVAANFQNGQMTKSEDYKFSPIYHYLIEQVRYE